MSSDTVQRLKNELESGLAVDDNDVRNLLDDYAKLETELRDTKRRASIAEGCLEVKESLNEALRQEVEKLKGRREHTQNWYASHYGKLEDWARTRLPAPWCNEFFSCIANGTYSHTDVGEAYICKAGFEVVPSGYVRMDDAKGQLIRDQTARAEVAEAKVAELEKQILENNIRAADNYAAAEIRTHAAEEKDFKWIDANESLPKHHNMVLVWRATPKSEAPGSVSMAFWARSEGWGWTRGDGNPANDFWGHITHWAALPEPPREEKV